MEREQDEGRFLSVSRRPVDDLWRQSSPLIAKPKVKLTQGCQSPQIRQCLNVHYLTAPFVLRIIYHLAINNQFILIRVLGDGDPMSFIGHSL